MDETNEQASIPAGEVIGGWRVVRLIGRGGMAEVYEVEDVRLGARYALKLFTYSRTEKEAARARFFSEGRLLAMLDHPRLVRVYEVDEHPGTGRPYFVMDLVLDPEGCPRTLAEIESPDEEQVATWYEDLRSGLGYIHAKGVLHRDLKLQNILVGPDGHAVISDFGIAKIFDPGLCADLGLSAAQTLIAERDGRQAVMGSVGYLAPEVELGVAASPQSDWYALGVLTFRLLTGVWCDSRTDVAGDLETYNPVWREILPKLLHSNPSGRECPSWRELEARRRDEESLRAERVYDETRDKLRRAKRSKKWLVGLLTVALALLAAGGTWWGVRRRERIRWEREYRLPPFEELCPIASAGGPAATDDDEDMTHEAHELAQIDAWVLTHRLLADVAAGVETRGEAAEDVRRLAQRARAEDDEMFGAHECSDEWSVLARMLDGMADRMDGGKGK